MFILHFYSKNFDNYKIIENLLKQKNTIKNIEINIMRNINESSFNDLAKNEKSLLNNYKTSSFYEYSDSIEKNLIINENENEDEEKSHYDYNLPKYSFLQFFLNNLYCCLKNHKKQEILHICNNIIMKYLSIDSILYYQIKMENLFNDYKWNNPSLNNIENNELFMKLKTLIINNNIINENNNY